MGKRKPITWVVTEEGYWECTSHAFNKHGYPHIKGQNGMRTVWEDSNGPVPANLVVRHKCDNRKCIRLDHLELGTWKDNTQDCKKRGRLNTPRGERRKDTKLTDDHVRAIRMSSENQGVLARRYGVHQSTISRIKRQEKRKYVPE